MQRRCSAFQYEPAARVLTARFPSPVNQNEAGSQGPGGTGRRYPAPLSRRDGQGANGSDWEVTGSSGSFPHDCLPALLGVEADLPQALVEGSERLVELLLPPAQGIRNPRRPVGCLEGVEDGLDVRGPRQDA